MMPAAAFFSPIEDPSQWTLASSELAVHAGFRYEGYSFRGVRATHTGSGGQARYPASGVIRTVTTTAPNRTWVELQPAPFGIRRITQASPWGLPTFYFLFEDNLGLSTSDPLVAANEVMRSATAVSIVVAGQDRVVRDASLWARELTTAIQGGGGDETKWKTFADQVASQIAPKADAPVLLLDHAGSPLESGALEVTLSGGPPFNVTLQPAHRGDLQKALGTAPTAPATLWGPPLNATSAVLRPLAPSGQSAEFELALLEDAAPKLGSATVTPAKHHLTLTDLNGWFAPQFVTPSTSPPLTRYTHGNTVTHFVNGREFFDHLFRQLQKAAGSGGGFNLAGWDMHPGARLTEPRSGESGVPLTLEDAVKAISNAQGRCSLLPSQFYQVSPNALSDAEALVLSSVLITMLLLSRFNATRSDAGGLLVLWFLFVASVAVLPQVIAFLFGPNRVLEPNKPAVDKLNVAGSACKFSPFPAQVEDNSAFPPPHTRFPFGVIFNITRRFGVYHQKLALLKETGGELTGYCGGIDLNSDRLDDAEHPVKKPFHDVHAGVKGPAVRDLGLTFQERWERDGDTAPLAVDPPAAPTPSPSPPPGDIVQVARTYFKAAAPSRALAFAPQGDRTIHDTLVQAISRAREYIYIADQYFTPADESPATRNLYRNVLIDKVKNGGIRKLIIVLPSVADQPFGEIVRSGIIGDLRANDPGGVVHVGYPRLRYLVPDNELRTSSGKCVLGENLSVPAGPPSTGVLESIVLGPETRVPLPPFWVAVEGELMWVWDEAQKGGSGALFPDPPKGTKRLLVDRGAETGLLKGGTGARAGPEPREHGAGAPATVLDLPGVYVHAKMMIVDDVFLSIGSANVNRRGFFHDGEINIFTMPAALKATSGNPVARLRRKLWAEMLGLPFPMAEPLLDDMPAAAKLFERSPVAGNRFVDIDAYPRHLMAGATTGDGLVGTVLQLLGLGIITVPRHKDLFDAAIDPSSGVAP